MADKASMDALIALVGDDMKQVNQVILERMQSSVALIPQLAGHLIAAGGKRLRPMITLATARLCGTTNNRHCALAACIEFLHTATLLHDDVVDESDLRRGEPSANAVFGNKPSVLVGDFLFSRAFQVMVADGDLEVLRILSDASAILAEGEVHQLVIANDLTADEAAYLSVIEAKTAVLFAAAAEIGGVAAGADAGRIAALRRFGVNLGVAFQLVDDALDYSAQQAALGKTVGDDFREGKLTLPVILAYAAGDATERAFWTRTIEESEQSSEDLMIAQTLMDKYGAIAETTARARRYADAAKEDLACFPDSPIRRALEEAVDFAVARAY